MPPMRKTFAWGAAVASIGLGCGRPPPPAAASPAAQARGIEARGDAGPSGTATADARPAPFSGLIVYRITFSSGDRPPRPGGELHYYISGNHWKIEDENGNVLALYDPVSNLIHYFRPRAHAVDAAIARGGPPVLEDLSETKSVLGCPCRGLLETTRERRIIDFLCPTLVVDPAQFPNHHFGGWTEELQHTGGALSLWSIIETADGARVSEAIRVERRQFDDDFWRLPPEAPPAPEPDRKP